MIASTSLSAFSAADIRPIPRPADRPPVQAPPEVGRIEGGRAEVERVRSQSPAPETRAAQEAGPPRPTPIPGRPAPRGSMLDLSV